MLGIFKMIARGVSTFMAKLGSGIRAIEIKLDELGVDTTLDDVRKEAIRSINEITNMKALERVDGSRRLTLADMESVVMKQANEYMYKVRLWFTNPTDKSSFDMYYTHTSHRLMSFDDVSKIAKDNVLRSDTRSFDTDLVYVGYDKIGAFADVNLFQGSY